MRKKSSDEVRNKAVNLYETGLSAQSIANQLGYNEATIRGWLKRYGIKLRVGGSYNIKYDEKLFIKIKEL